MSKMNSCRAYDEICTIHPNVAALFMSAYVADIIREKGAVTEGFCFVSKPIKPM